MNQNTKISAKITKAENLIYKDQLPKARKLLNQIAKQDNNNAHAWYLLGVVNGLMNIFDEAESCLRKAIRLQPDFTDGYFVLAKLLLARNSQDDAIEYLNKVVELQPDYTEAHILLGKIQFSLLNFDLAMSAYEHAHKSQPDNTDILCSLADMMQNNMQDPHLLRERVDKSINYYKFILEQEPDHIEATTGLANALVNKGSASDAISVLKLRLEDDPVDSRVINTYARLCKKTRSFDKASTIIEQQLQNQAIVGKERTELLYSLGNIHDSIGNYEAAFAAYKQACDMDASAGFDPSYAESLVNDLISVFSEETVSELPVADNTSELPVFILGMPRSGSSLVEQILSCHKDIYSAGEIRDIPRISDELHCADKNILYPGTIACTSKEEINRHANEYLDRIGEFSPNAIRITDKINPNFLHIGLISMLFPRAKIIHTIRNPLDTCLSCYFQQWVIGGLYNKNLVNIGRFYKLYEKLMAHWHKVLPITILDVHYEHLVQDLESTSRKIVSFCELDWDPDCLEFYKDDRVVLTSSADQVCRPIYTSSVDRWRNYENHLGPLKESLGISFKKTGA